MKKFITLFSLTVIFLTTFTPAFSQSKGIPNKNIDSKQFQKDVLTSQKLRLKRRVTEDQFIQMSKNQNTIVLDTRSEKKFKELHVKGAKHLNFSDITKDTLTKIIPNKNTRILIYCNNNFDNEPKSFPTKMAPAALNLSTFVTLYTYGYRNIYELGPALDIKKTKIQFASIK